jgi:hypothetical protein
MSSTAPRGINQAAYQKRINQITGTADGKPLIKLIWCPDEYRWMPHKLGDDPPGYTFPFFCNGRNENGEFEAPKRWGLLQRLEWEQFGPTWEAIRYKKQDGAVWDLKGPCPSEKYVELKLHTDHNGKCCPCLFDCTCEGFCEGIPIEPDENLMGWIRKVAWESKRDPDVDPFADTRFFEATHAQREVKNAHDRAFEKDRADVEAFDREAVDLFLRSPVTVSSMVKSAKAPVPSGFKKQKGSRLYTLT